MRERLGVLVRNLALILLLTFATKMAAQTPPAIFPGGAVNGASFRPGPVALGSIVSIFGTDLASVTASADQLPLPTTLGGATLRINETLPAPLFFSSAGQVNVQIPWELAGQSQAVLSVSVGSATSAPQTVNLAPFAPGIFTTTQSGVGQGAVLIANTDVLAAPAGSIPGRNTRPANRGEFITIFCTGLGDVTNRPASGAPAVSSPLSTTTVVPQVTIGGIPAGVDFSGLSPGFVGLYQVNVQVPDSAPVGDPVPVVITIGGVSSNAVNIAIAGSAPPPPPPTGVTISSFNKTTADSFSVLTINGSGFDTQNSAISVVFIPTGDAVPVTVPVFSATSTALQVVVPPLVSSTTGGLASGAASVQVVQITGDMLLTSNTLSGLTITAVPNANPSLRAGAVAKAYLTAALNVMQTVKSLPGATPSLVAAINAQSAAHTALIAEIDKIIQDPQRNVTLPTSNQLPFVLDAETLRILDRLIIASVPQFLNAAQASAALGDFSVLGTTEPAVTSCPPNTGDPFTDSFICSRQRYGEELHQKGAALVQAGAKFEMGFYLGFLGGYAAQGFAAAGVITERAAHALGLAADIAASYISAYATASPPPKLSDTVATVASKVVDTHLFLGLPITDSVVKATSLIIETSKIATGSPDRSPLRGIILASPALRASFNQRPHNFYSCFVAGVRGITGASITLPGPEADTSCKPGDTVTVQSIAAPTTQQSTPVQNAVEPPPDVRKFDGTYSGSLSGIASDEDGSTPVSGPVGFTANNGIITVTSPGPGTGALTATGVITVGGVTVSDASCTFGGRFQISSSNRASAGGGWSCTFSGGTSSGFWNASR